MAALEREKRDIDGELRERGDFYEKINKKRKIFLCDLLTKRAFLC
jgi:hypothetical protein